MITRFSRLAAIIALAAVPVVSAQGQRIVHTTGFPGRTAGIQPAPSAPPAPGTYRVHGTPVTVSSDGRVYADFGHGYEQLVRNCAIPVSQFATPTQPQVVQPAPYVQPVPNQPTASQQMLQQPTPGQRTNSRACWSTDSKGQPLIER